MRSQHYVDFSIHFHRFQNPNTTQTPCSVRKNKVKRERETKQTCKSPALGVNLCSKGYSDARKYPSPAKGNVKRKSASNQEGVS